MTYTHFNIQCNVSIGTNGKKQTLLILKTLLTVTLTNSRVYTQRHKKTTRKVTLNVIIETLGLQNPDVTRQIDCMTKHELCIRNIYKHYNLKLYCNKSVTEIIKIRL